MIVGDELGISHDRASTRPMWVPGSKALQDDPLEVFPRRSDAEDPPILRAGLRAETGAGTGTGSGTDSGQPPHELTLRTVRQPGHCPGATRHGREVGNTTLETSRRFPMPNRPGMPYRTHHAAVNNALFLTRPMPAARTAGDQLSAGCSSRRIPRPVAEVSRRCACAGSGPAAGGTGRALTPGAMPGQAISIQEATMQTPQPIQTEAQLKAEA